MIKKIKTNKMFIISIIAILFIPAMYAANFLFAFADPYNNLSNVPVAIVNDDSGTTSNGKEVNIGDEFISNLKKSSNFKWYFVSDKEALSGMKNNKYYFTVKIPKDFSSNVYSTLTGNSKEADLVYMANDNKNYICGVLGNALINELESQLNKKIISEFVSDLDTNLSSGTTELSSAVSQILDGSSQITTSLSSLVSGSKELLDNTTKLYDSSKTLSSGTSSLQTGYETFNTMLNTASTSLSSVNSGYVSVDSSMVTYRQSLVDALNASNLPDSTKQALIANYDSIYQTNAYLTTNLTKISGGVTALASNSNTIYSSIKDINTGVNTISGYLGSLKTGTEELYSGASQLYTGSTSLNSGIVQLNSGVSTFNKTIADLNLTTNADEIASPVTRVDKAYSSVENYGYGFAPYFISLGLFVGSLITTIVLSMKSKKSKNPNTITHSLKKLGLFAFVVISQTAIVDTILLTTKITVANPVLFIAFTMLIGLTFMAIVQMFTTLFGDVGRFLCIILLTLQLTACGGTFPIETAPKFYNIISPFMPMTYTVNGLRSIIGSGNMSIVGQSSLILGCIIVVCYTCILIYFKKSKKFA